jgi:hypothetical protein
VIGTLVELEAFTKRLGRENPSMAAECVLAGPGLGDAEVAALLKAVPGLPESYLKCARLLRFVGVELAGFSLSPLVNRGSLVDSLTRTNSTVNPLWARLQSENLLEVAVGDSELVAVAGAGSTLPLGTVLMIHLFDTDEAPALLASDFEHFLIYAGNLMDISATMSGRKALQEFELRLGKLGATTEMVDGWWEVAESLLE